MANDRVLPFDEYAIRLYEPTKHETRMLVNRLSSDAQFHKVHRPRDWGGITAYIKSQEHPDVTKVAFKNLWLAYSAYVRRMTR